MPNMVPVEPSGINAAGKVALYFVPAIADPKAPKVDELKAGTNISKIVYAWDPNGSQGSEERAHYGSASVATSAATPKYDPAAIEWDDDPQGTTPAAGEYAHRDILTSGTKGFFVDRRGLAPETEPAADQIVDIYPVELGQVFRIAVDVKAAGEKFRNRQAVFITADPAIGVKVKA